MMRQVRAKEITLSRQRAFAHSATLVTLDKQGRVTLDERLRHVRPPHAELEGRRVRATSTAPRCGPTELYEQIAAAGRGELAGGRE